MSDLESTLSVLVVALETVNDAYTKWAVEWDARIDEHEVALAAAKKVVDAQERGDKLSKLYKEFQSIIRSKRETGDVLIAESKAIAAKIKNLIDN